MCVRQKKKKRKVAEVRVYSLASSDGKWMTLKRVGVPTSEAIMCVNVDNAYSVDQHGALENYSVISFQNQLPAYLVVDKKTRDAFIASIAARPARRAN